jgi:hypothetical protein
MTSKTMEFETTPFKTGSSKSIKKNISDNVLDKISTGRILWYLVKRHKFGIVLIWAILMTVSYMFPPIWDILGSIVIR